MSIQTAARDQESIKSLSNEIRNIQSKDGSGSSAFYAFPQINTPADISKVHLYLTQAAQTYDTLNNLKDRLGSIDTNSPDVWNIFDAETAYKQPGYYGDATINSSYRVMKERYHDYVRDVLLPMYQRKIDTFKNELKRYGENDLYSKTVISRTINPRLPQDQNLFKMLTAILNELKLFAEDLQRRKTGVASGATTQDAQARALARQEQLQTKLKGQSQGYVNAPVTTNLQATPNQQTAVKGTLFNTIRSL